MAKNKRLEERKVEVERLIETCTQSETNKTRWEVGERLIESSKTISKFKVSEGER